MVRQEETCTIDFNQFAFGFQPLKTSELAQLESVPEQLEVKRLTEDLSEDELQRLLHEEEQLVQSQANEILEEAKKEANLILKEAKTEANSMYERAQEEGKKQGYVEGLQSGTEELKRLEQELKDQIKENQEYVEKELKQLEMKLVDVLIQTLQRMTGVLIEDKQEVILHLIKQNLNHMEKQKDYRIKVSAMDYEFVCKQKTELMEIVGENISFEVLLDEELGKNQCLIETESNIFDCSLDVQLSNLIANLKLLSMT